MWVVRTPQEGVCHKWPRVSLCGWTFLLLTSSTRAMLHCGLAIYIKKYLKAKEEL